MALLPPFYLDCVVAIGFPDAGGSIKYGATGFFFGLLAEKGREKKDNTYYTFLATNRHVFENKIAGKIRVNPNTGGNAKEFDIRLIGDDGKKLWLNHPDPEVDVALMQIGINILYDQGIRCGFFEQDTHALRTAEYVKRGGSEGDGVFVLGFPLGETGGDLNYVIVRTGSIARVRDCAAGAAKTFLIDASIFPGNSGGPVVNKPDAISIAGTAPVNFSYLIGMVSAYVPYKDVAVSQQTGVARIIFEENSGLAVVVPIQYIEEVAALAVASKLAPPPSS